jgi:hypothetical protein
MTPEELRLIEALAAAAPPLDADQVERLRQILGPRLARRPTRPPHYGAFVSARATQENEVNA